MNIPKFILTLLGMLLLTCLPLTATDFGEADSCFRYTRDYKSYATSLEAMLETATPGAEKSEVLWRLSRVYLLMGEAQCDKERKKPFYARGIAFAEQAISENPSNPAAYMWHCASVGRDVQTKALMEQAKSVPVMMGDLEMILDKLGYTDYSEAWQALAEIYFHHPFKSDDAAINFMRKAVRTIPADELRISTSIFLAQLLMKRGWSVQKRKSAASQNAAAYAKAKGNIEKYTYSDSVDPQIGSMSDKEEAAAIVAAAKDRYHRASRHSDADEKDYKELLKIN